MSVTGWCSKGWQFLHHSTLYPAQGDTCPAPSSRRKNTSTQRWPGVHGRRASVESAYFVVWQLRRFTGGAGLVHHTQPHNMASLRVTWRELEIFMPTERVQQVSGGLTCPPLVISATGKSWAGPWKKAASFVNPQTARLQADGGRTAAWSSLWRWTRRGCLSIVQWRLVHGFTLLVCLLLCLVLLLFYLIPLFSIQFSAEIRAAFMSGIIIYSLSLLSLALLLISVLLSLLMSESVTTADFRIVTLTDVGVCYHCWFQYCYP